MVERKNLSDHVPEFRNPTDEITWANPTELTGIVTATSRVDFTGGLNCTGIMTATGSVTFTRGFKTQDVEVTAASGGTQIPDGARYVTVSNGGAATNYVILPTAEAGVEVTLISTVGYEVRSEDPTSVPINGGTGANAEMAVAADTPLVHCAAITASWVCYGSNTSTASYILEAAA